MGAVPVWYRTLKAAQYLRVAPWDLASQSLSWVVMAEAAQQLESDHERDKRRDKRLGGAPG